VAAELELFLLHVVNKLYDFPQDVALDERFLEAVVLVQLFISLDNF